MGIQDRHAFDEIGEFAHIARPAIAAQGRNGGGIETDRALARGFEIADQFVQQQRNVIHTPTQGRHFDGENIDSIIQVFAKGAALDHVFEILVRRRQNAHIGLDRAGAADFLETALFQHPQQLDLHVERHVADFVEKQGAAVGAFKAADGGRDGAGESAAFVAEQLAFQQFPRNRAAIHRHERLAFAAGNAMQVARHDFLAGARFARDQDVHFGVGEPRHHFPDALNRRTDADQALHRGESPRGIGIRRAGKMLMAQARLVQNVEQVAEMRFGVGFHEQAGAQWFAGEFGNIPCSQQDDGGLRQSGVEFIEQSAQLSGTVSGEQYGLDHAQTGRRLPPAAGIGGGNGLVEEFEFYRKLMPGGFVVADQQYGRFAGGHGHDIPKRGPSLHDVASG